MPDGLQDPGRTGTNPDIPAADATGGPDDGPPLRHPFRQFFARHRTLDLTYRVAVAVIGAAVVVGGIILIPLPGPGWLIVFGGLAILATEFEWAGRLLDFARRQGAWLDPLGGAPVTRRSRADRAGRAALRLGRALGVRRAAGRAPVAAVRSDPIG